MINKEMKKATIANLIARAEQRKKDKKEVRKLYVKSLDSTITILKPDRALVLESLNMDEAEADKYLVYNSVVEPNLKDTNLREAYGVIAPLDIVDEIFEPGEVAGISKEIVRLAGYGDSVQVVNDIKN